MEVSNRLLFLLVLTGCSLHIETAATLKGDVNIGAILTVHGPSPDVTKCGKVNYLGLAVSEAIKLAVRTINAGDDILGQAGAKTTLGYAIHDDCGSVSKAKDIAYTFNTAQRALAKKSSPSSNSTKEAISFVISAFDNEYSPVVRLLSFEHIPQISYSGNNIRLNQNASTDKDAVKLLLSAYPEDVTKIRAAADLLSTLDFQYVYIVTTNDKRGEDGKRLLKSELKQQKICHSEDLIVSDKKSAKKIVRKITENKLISVVVLHCTKKEAIMIFEETKAHNLTHLIFISTYSWKNEELYFLRPYAVEVEGMIYIGDAAQRPQGYHQYAQKLKEPFTASPWLQDAFRNEGGPESCLSSDEATRKKSNCKEFTDKVVTGLRLEAHAAAVAIDAVYAVAYGIQARDRAGGVKQGLFEYVRDTEFVSQLTGNIIRFNQDGVVLSNSFVLFNTLGNTSNSLSQKRVGTWRIQDNPQLVLNKKILRWKDSSSTVPLSRCNEDCVRGTIQKFKGTKCCWTCIKCPNDTISNKTNAPSCISCPGGQTPNPAQSKCFQYEAIYFHWYEPTGEFMIFFITAGLCVTLFTLGIFSQNSESPVVKSSGYKLMCFMLIGVGLTFVTPVPLFVRPSTIICCVYVSIFNMSLTIPLAVLVTKTAAFTNFFLDEDGEVKRGTLTSRPRFVLVLILLAIQGLILAAGLILMPSKVNVLPTEHWDVKYLECDSHRSYVFWAGYGYNVLLSLVINFLSCSAKDMEANFGELKYICLTTCIFYLIALLYISVVFAVKGKHLVEGAGLMIIIFGFSFLAAFFFPKLYNILFRSDKSKSGIEASPLMHEEEEPHLHTHSSAATPFQRHGILSMKIKDDDEQESKA